MHTLVMTGATSGIGRPAAEELLRNDPDLHLVLLARGDTGRAALAELRELSEHVTHVEADLANLASVTSAVGKIQEQLARGTLPPLTGIAGNAGVQTNDALHTTSQGYETTFAVNVLAHHVIVAGLAPHLHTPGHIVLTVSDTHFGDLRHGGGMPAPQWSDPATLAAPGAYPRPESPSAGRTAYTTSKLAGIYLVHEWARRAPEGVTVVSYNPSLVGGTGLVRDGGLAAQIVMKGLARLLALTPLADTVAGAGRKLAAAIRHEEQAPSGAYVDRGTAMRSSEESYDAERERGLWEFAERVRSNAQARTRRP